MCRPDLSLLAISEALQRLTAWLFPQMPPRLLHAHEKISDAELVAVALLQCVHNVSHFVGFQGAVDFANGIQRESHP